MREIKFRGRAGAGYWVIGSLFINEKGHAYIICVDGSKTPVFLETVGEFIGRKDKNGKEIYEGDIVKAATENTPLIWEVQWGDEDVAFILVIEKRKEAVYFPAINHQIFEVIGNIYENPELINSLSADRQA